MTEHGVVVVFDTTAMNHRAAARKVLAALVAHPNLHEPAIDGRCIESWWFPEAGDKGVDRNDNADMTLVNRDRLALLVQAYDTGNLELLAVAVNQLRQQLAGHAL